MAIIKSFDVGDGNTAEYCKVRMINVNAFYVDVYKSKADRGNNKKPSIIGKTSYFVNSTESELKENGKSPLVLAYNYLKTLSEFDGAVDDI